MLRHALFTALAVVLALSSAKHKSSIEGKRVIKEIYPDATASNISFGAGYDSVTLSRTGTIPVHISSVPSQTSSGMENVRFIKHIFQIKHFNNREDLRREFEDESEIAKSEGYMGVSKSGFINMLTSEELSVLDSFVMVDIDIVTDSASVSGQVTLTTAAQSLLASKRYKDFIAKFGTHYLRRKVYGGKLLFLIKFQSKSREDKELIDLELKNITGYIGDSREFRNKMGKIEKVGKLNLILYTLGGPPFPGHLDLQTAITFVLSFSGHVGANQAIRGLEFVAIWSIAGVNREFCRTVFSYQRETDRIIGISAGLRDVARQVKDIALLRYFEMPWISEIGWTKLKAIEKVSIQSRINLGKQLQTGDIDDLEKVSQEYQNKEFQLQQEIDVALEDEKHYDPKDGVYLKAVKQSAYIAGRDWQNYARASTTEHLEIYFEDSSPGVQQISYSAHRSIFIKSSLVPDMVLCMAPNYYGIFWKSQSSAHIPYCTWSLKHSTDPRKSILDYSDKFLIYSVHWPEWAFGLSDDNAWVYAVKSSGSNLRDDLDWQMEKVKPSTM